MEAPDVPPPWFHYRHLWERLEIPAKTILLREGAVARDTYFLERG